MHTDFDRGQEDKINIYVDKSFIDLKHFLSI